MREVGVRYDPTMSLTNPELVTVDDVGGLEIARVWARGIAAVQTPGIRAVRDNYCATQLNQ